MSKRNERDNRSALTPLSAEEMRALRDAQLNRRKFLRRSGSVVAVTIGAGAGASVISDSAVTQEGEAGAAAPFDYEFDGVPDTPSEPPPRELQVLSEEEAAVIEALTAQMLPGTEDDPGAREAGVVYYIDNLLSSNSGIHDAVYTSGPFARTFEGDDPPSEDDDETIWVHADEIGRYGYQAPLAPLQVYRIAIERVQRHSQETFGSGVAELSDEDQRQIIWDLLDENMDGWDQFSPIAFFHTLRRHTSEGMFSDPAYGGNRDLVGWRLVGFPGAQRAYAPEELVDESEPRPPQAMSDLPHFHPGVARPGDHPDVVQPVREGEDQDGS